MSVSKVVRVEEVHGTFSQNRNSATALLGAGEKNDRVIKPSQDKVSQQGTDLWNSEENWDGGDDEAKDKIYPLPQDWPRIKELSRPMSCALTNSRQPCVKKAVSHLELIQNIIDDWFRKAIEESRNQSQNARALSPWQATQKKQLRFLDQPSRSSISSTNTSKSPCLISVTPPLTVVGVGATSSGGEEIKEESDIEVPYLGADDVINEVLILLARLELDRQEIHKEYIKETEKVFTLQKKVDDLCLRRLKDLPVLVQREHASRIMDLNELHWHVAYNTRHEAKAQRRKDAAEEINTGLVEAVKFTKMHIPLVQEKLSLELQAMDKVKKAQVETNQELASAAERRAKTKQKLSEASNKAETERGHIKEEIDTVSKELSAISEALSNAKMIFNKYSHQLDDVEQQMKDNLAEAEVLEEKKQNVKTAENKLAAEVRQIHIKITEAEFEFQQLASRNREAERDLMNTRMKNSVILQEAHHTYRKMEYAHRTLAQKNSLLTIEIQDLLEKIAECDRAKETCDKNIARLHNEIERTNALMLATVEEYNHISDENSILNQQLETAKTKALQTEEHLKNNVEKLRHQIKEELHNKGVLRARIEEELVQIEKAREESARKQERSESLSEDLKKAVEEVENKVERLRTIKAEKIKEREEILFKTQMIREQFNERSIVFDEFFDSLTPRVEELRETLKRLEFEEEERRIQVDELEVEYQELQYKEEDDSEQSFILKSECPAVAVKEERHIIPFVSHSENEVDCLKNYKSIPRYRLNKQAKSSITQGLAAKKEQQPAIKEQQPAKKEQQPSFIARLETVVGKLDENLKEMTLQTDFMTKKMEEMDDAKVMMDRVVSKTQLLIDEKEKELIEIKLQRESSQKLIQNLRSDIAIIDERRKSGNIQHLQLVADRTVVLKEQEREIELMLQENQDLASKHRQLMNEYLITKEKMLRGLEGQVKLESTIADINRVKALQSKMHGFLMAYFKLSGLYLNAEMNRLENKSYENGCRVIQVQEDMETAMDEISKFIEKEFSDARSIQEMRQPASGADDQGEGRVENRAGLHLNSSLVLAS